MLGFPGDFGVYDAEHVIAMSLVRVQLGPLLHIIPLSLSPLTSCQLSITLCLIKAGNAPNCNLESCLIGQWVFQANKLSTVLQRTEGPSH